jgi:hypothetical protein
MTIPMDDNIGPAEPRDLETVSDDALGIVEAFIQERPMLALVWRWPASSSPGVCSILARTVRHSANPITSTQHAAFAETSFAGPV